MFLHENKTVFLNAVYRASQYFGVDSDIIVKDYFVFMLLRLIVQKNPQTLFKGGTSLSKAFNVINRFSEDIDINAVPSVALTEGMRGKFNHNVADSYTELGLTLGNDLKSNSQFVSLTADVPYMSVLPKGVTKKLKVESVLRKKGRVLTCKHEPREIYSMIYDYLVKTQGSNVGALIKKYGLEPFVVQTQDIGYTLCEKLIAIGNYYLRGRDNRASRHLYDIYKLSCIVPIDGTLRTVLLEVVSYVRERGIDNAIINGNNLEVVIYKSLKEGFFKNDYINVTSRFIYENVPYDVCKDRLYNILLFGLADTISGSNVLRSLYVGEYDKASCKYSVRSSVTGGVLHLSKSELRERQHLLQNKKFTSDGKLIDRFR